MEPGAGSDADARTFIVEAGASGLGELQLLLNPGVLGRRDQGEVRPVAVIGGRPADRQVELDRAAAVGVITDSNRAQ